MATKDSGGGQERANRSSDEVEETGADPVDATSDVQERVGALTDDVDALLDDIDEVLESNAEEFVKGYVQKGGQ